MRRPSPRFPMDDVSRNVLMRYVFISSSYLGWGELRRHLKGWDLRSRRRTRTSFLAPSLRAFTTPAILRARRSSSPL